MSLPRMLEICLTTAPTFHAEELEKYNEKVQNENRCYLMPSPEGKEKITLGYFPFIVVLLLFYKHQSCIYGKEKTGKDK